LPVRPAPACTSSTISIMDGQRVTEPKNIRRRQHLQSLAAAAAKDFRDPVLLPVKVVEPVAAWSTSSAPLPGKACKTPSPMCLPAPV